MLLSQVVEHPNLKPISEAILQWAATVTLTLPDRFSMHFDMQYTSEKLATCIIANQLWKPCFIYIKVMWKLYVYVKTMYLFQMLFKHLRNCCKFDYFGDILRSFAQGIISWFNL